MEIKAKADKRDHVGAYRKPSTCSASQLRIPERMAAAVAQINTEDPSAVKKTNGICKKHLILALVLTAVILALIITILVLVSLSTNSLEAMSNGESSGNLPCSLNPKCLEGTAAPQTIYPTPTPLDPSMLEGSGEGEGSGITGQTGIFAKSRKSEIPRILLSALHDTSATSSSQSMSAKVPQIEEVEDSSETTDIFQPFW